VSRHRGRRTTRVPGYTAELLLQQIDGKRAQAWSILRPARRLRWERPHAHGLAGEAADVQRLMLGHRQAHPWQVLHLPALAQHHRRLIERRLALHADHRPMLHHRVRRRHQVQRLAAMAQLPAGILAAASPQALRLGARPVARRRLAAVVAVLRQPCAQLGVLRCELLHLRRQLGNLRFQGGDFFVKRSSREEASLPLPPRRTVHATRTRLAPHLAQSPCRHVEVCGGSVRDGPSAVR
jgi:hypothetical protein